MPIRVYVDFTRKLRVVEFDGQVTPAELEDVARLYFDRDYYIFDHKELVIFTEQATLFDVSALDLGELADAYTAAMGEREDARPVRSAWVVNDHVVNEARMWRQFARGEELPEKSRHHVADLATAIEVLELPPAWQVDIEARSGFQSYPNMG